MSCKKGTKIDHFYSVIWSPEGLSEAYKQSPEVIKKMTRLHKTLNHLSLHTPQEKSKTACEGAEHCKRKCGDENVDFRVTYHNDKKGVGDNSRSLNKSSSSTSAQCNTMSVCVCVSFK